MTTIYVQFYDPSQEKIINAFSSPQDETVWPNMGEVEEDDQRYIAFINPWLSNEALAESARKTRDDILRNFCDIGVLMIQRAIRMEADAAKKVALNAKLAELDAYAVALQDVPQQEGFPTNIVWPVAPTE